MVDFIKANPYVSVNDYMYKLSIAKIQMMSMDFTHTKYLSEKDVERRKIIKNPKKVRNITDFSKNK